MLVLPFLLIADFHIARELFAICSLHRHRKCQQFPAFRLSPLASRLIAFSPNRLTDSTPITIGLLWKTLHYLYLHSRWIRQKSAIPFHTTHICRWQNHFFSSPTDCTDYHFPIDS
jgi:hypothetical protein